jgi:hypothetical protein
MSKYNKTKSIVGTNLLLDILQLKKAFNTLKHSLKPVTGRRNNFNNKQSKERKN